MSSTKIDPTQVDLPGTSADLLSGDGEVAINIGANLTFAGAVLSGPSTLLRNVLFVSTTGDDATGNGSINLPFATLQAAHDYALSNFRPETHIVIAIAPGDYSGALSVTRSRTHFSAIGAISSSDRTVSVTKADLTVDCSVPGPVEAETVSFEGIYFQSGFASSRPTVSITGTGLFTTIFDGCTIESASSDPANFAMFCDNTSGQPVVEVKNSLVTSTDVSTDSTTILAERGDWRISDSQVVNLSTKIASAISATEDSVVSAKDSTIRSQGLAPTVVLDGLLTHPTIKLRLDNCLVESLSPGDGVSDCSGINLGRRQYTVATQCSFNVVDVSAATYCVNGGNPSYLDLGAETYIGASNRLIADRVTPSRLDAWRGQYTFVTADYAALLSDYVIDCDGTLKVTLPTTATILGRMYVVKNSGLGSVIVQSAGGELFDGAPNLTLATFDAARVMSTGTSWIIL